MGGLFCCTSRIAILHFESLWGECGDAAMGLSRVDELRRQPIGVDYPWEGGGQSGSTKLYVISNYLWCEERIVMILLQVLFNKICS